MEHIGACHAHAQNPKPADLTRTAEPTWRLRATLLAAFSYLTTAPQAVENFRHVGYPQQLRVLLDIGKLAEAIALLLPRLPTLKEWAYAGFTFMWIAAVVAHYLAGDGVLSLLPVAGIASLAVSCVTRPANRRGSAKAILA